MRAPSRKVIDEIITANHRSGVIAPRTLPERSWSRAAAASVWETIKINFSQVFAGQAVGIKEVHDDIWLVSFMDYDLGYFDLDTRVLEPLDNPFGPRLSPM
jgi:hypothetical protein